MKILVAGDFCPQNRVAKLFDEEKYDSVLGDVKRIIKNSDYSIVNFECPIKLGGETPNLNRLSLYCSENGMKAAADAGFNCVTLANNHFRDWGDGGVKSTLAICEKYGLDHVGGGSNLNKASQTLYKQIEGQTLAIVNCCEHEFSLATPNRGGSNPLSLVSQYNAIKAAREKADYVLVIVHGGHEHFQLPSPRMVDSYRFFIDVGADAVINHHQHCISGYEIYKNKPIFYGIGNFCFDMQNPPSELWYTGYMVELVIEESRVNYIIHPYSQCNTEPTVKLIDKEAIKDEVEKLNEIINDPLKLQKEIETYYNKSMKDVNDIINPLLTARYFSRLYRKGLLPNVISKTWLMYLCNYTMCESHRDKMDFFFEHNIY